MSITHTSLIYHFKIATLARAVFICCQRTKCPLLTLDFLGFFRGKRNDSPHLCEDVRLYTTGNLNSSVCLLPSFIINVSLKRLIMDGASIVMSMLSTLQREQPNCTSPCRTFSFGHIYEFPKIINRWHQFSQRQDHWVF
jgi:hypothetical protein